jgi:AcrR family transcriptional regulator
MRTIRKEHPAGPKPQPELTARKTGRPKKDDERADARELLLDAAHELMCERSTIDVPVNEIAGRAGLNVALINYYFGGKEGLLLQLAMRHRSGYAAVLDTLIASPHSASRKLTLHVRGMVRAFRRVPYLQRLQHKILRDSSEEIARECGVALVEPLVRFYRQLVAQGAADGTLRPIDPMHLYMTVVGSCDFLYSATASLKYGFEIDAVSDAMSEDYIEHLVSLLTRGLFVGPGAVEH